MKKGFTLIELLVVVLIIGILAAVAVPQYTKAVERSKVAEAKIMLKAMYQAQKLCQMEGIDCFGSNFAEKSSFEPPSPWDSENCDPSCFYTKDWEYSSEDFLYAYRRNESRPYIAIDYVDRERWYCEDHGTEWCKKIGMKLEYQD